MPVDSLIGYDTVTLTDQSSTANADSLIGYATVTLTDPPPVGNNADSLVGYATVTLRNPHRPVGVMTSSGLKYSPVLSWTGTAWR